MARSLLRRCLTKDPKLRLRDIGEARIALELGDDADAAGSFRRETPQISLPIAAMATAIALAGIGGLHHLPSDACPMLRRYAFCVPA